MLHIAPDVALGVSHGQNGAQRAAALDLQSDGAVVHLLHIAHHGGRRQEASKGRCGRGKGFMDIPRPFHNIRCRDRYSLHKAIRRHGAH